MLKLNCDAHILKISHKTRKSDDSILKMYVDLSIDNVPASASAWLLGTEDGSQVTDHLSDGVSQRFVGIDHIVVDKKTKVKSAECIFGNLSKQCVEVGKFTVKPGGLGLSTVCCRITIDEPGERYYEQMLNFEGRSMRLKLEPDRELNLPRPKEKQEQIDLDGSKAKARADAVGEALQKADKPKKAKGKNGAEQPAPGV